MRFSVKAKLAGAFGAVIILSLITGGVGYVKLNQLAANSADLVARANHMDKANDIQTTILYQVRAEKISSSPRPTRTSLNSRPKSRRSARMRNAPRRN